MLLSKITVKIWQNEIKLLDIPLWRGSSKTINICGKLLFLFIFVFLDFMLQLKTAAEIWRNDRKYLIISINTFRRNSEIAEIHV